MRNKVSSENIRDSENCRNIPVERKKEVISGKTETKRERERSVLM